MAYRKGLKLDPVRAKCPGPELERWAALISSCLSTYILYESEVLRTTHETTGPGLSEKDVLRQRLDYFHQR